MILQFQGKKHVNLRKKYIHTTKTATTTIITKTAIMTITATTIITTRMTIITLTAGTIIVITLYFSYYLKCAFSNRCVGCTYIAMWWSERISV